jgi:membrane peptidoglycan carboxypeptidase
MPAEPCGRPPFQEWPLDALVGVRIGQHARRIRIGRRPRAVVGADIDGVVAGLVALGLAAGTVCLLSLRSVSDAPARVRAILVAHHEPTGVLPSPRKLAAAVVSVEDEHFYANFAVNVLSGVGRAALATLQAEQDPGGSTIEQQLAKLLYGQGGGLGATLREIGLGVKLDLAYSKAEILRMYVNAAYYGQGFWGVPAASRGYFRIAPADLTWAEAAMLAGLLQAPSAYDPVTHYALAKQRQDHVLTQLVANGYLSARQAAAAYRTRLPLS